MVWPFSCALYIVGNTVSQLPLLRFSLLLLFLHDVLETFSPLLEVEFHVFFCSSDVFVSVNVCCTLLFGIVSDSLKTKTPPFDFSFPLFRFSSFCFVFKIFLYSLCSFSMCVVLRQKKKENTVKGSSCRDRVVSPVFYPLLCLSLSLHVTYPLQADGVCL